jgi:hypothetical protein
MGRQAGTDVRSQLDDRVLGNLIGALATALILFISKQYEFGGGAVGVQTLSIAAARRISASSRRPRSASLQRTRLPRRLALLQRPDDDRQDPLDRPPIAAFVAAGFEHCVANMFFIRWVCS